MSSPTGTGSPVYCSTEAQAQPILKCSVFAPTSNSCSTENLGTTGTPGTTGNAQCSTVLVSGNGNLCSVGLIGGSTTTMQCSADSTSTSFCSAATGPNPGGQSDFCSILTGVTNAQCTALGTGTNTNCSVTGGATASQCSVQGQSYSGGVCRS
jgi:hypothetical protein